VNPTIPSGRWQAKRMTTDHTPAIVSRIRCTRRQVLVKNTWSCFQQRHGSAGRAKGYHTTSCPTRGPPPDGLPTLSLQTFGINLRKVGGLRCGSQVSPARPFADGQPALMPGLHGGAASQHSHALGRPDSGALPGRLVAASWCETQPEDCEKARGPLWCCHDPRRTRERGGGSQPRRPCVTPPSRANRPEASGFAAPAAVSW